MSILIPTMNRPLFIIRALYFYAENRFRGHICIGDSSDREEFEKTQIVVQQLKERLQVIHRFYPKDKYQNEAIVVRELVSLAPTKYVCQFGDDDFLIPDGIDICAEYLDKNHDYVAACGRARIEFCLENDALFFGRISKTIEVKENDFDKGSGAERFKLYMGNAVAPTYSLYRKAVFEDMYRHTDVAVTRYFGPEVLTSAIGAISGKAKLLNVLTLMFQVHKHHIFSWYDQSIYETIVHPSFSETIKVIREQLAGQLSSRDKIDSVVAMKIVDKELWAHIYRMLSWQYKERYPIVERRSSSLISRVKELRGIGSPVEVSLIGIFWRMRKLITNLLRNLKKKQFTVSSLHKAGSVYHEDFSRVYYFLLEPPHEISTLYQINYQEKR